MRREEIWLNNTSLRDVDPRIVSVRLIEQDVQNEITYGQNQGMDGQRVLGRRRVSKRVRVSFAIRELYDLPARSAAIDAVNAWARDGILRASVRPGQQLNVICTEYARAEDVRAYADELSLAFEAAGVPYWQEAQPSSLTLSGDSASGSLVVRGNAPTVLDATVTPTGGALTALTLTATAGGRATVFAFSGLSVAQGTALVIAHDAQGLISISAGSVSLLGKRTAASDDELVALPGVAAISCEANTACSAVVSARGRYR